MACIFYQRLNSHELISGAGGCVALRGKAAATDGRSFALSAAASRR
jgi:hypothetical protein